MRKLSIAVLAIASVLMSCSDKGGTPTNGSTPTDFRDVWWRLESFKSDSNGTIVLVPPEAYLVFFGDSLLTGKTDSICMNEYGALYQIGTDDSLSIGDIMSTRAACRPNYWDYLHALQGAVSYRLSGNQLTVFHHDGSKKMVFVKQ